MWFDITMSKLAPSATSSALKARRKVTPRTGGRALAKSWARASGSIAVICRRSPSDAAHAASASGRSPPPEPMSSSVVDRVVESCGRMKRR